MNDQENIIRIQKRGKKAIKINVPLTGEDIFNLMKGGKYEWEMVPHDMDNEIRIDLRIHGLEEENILKELFAEHPADDVFKFGDCK
jgi:hypothetical protein